MVVDAADLDNNDQRTTFHRRSAQSCGPMAEWCLDRPEIASRNKPSSAPFSISENGQFIAGVSETGHYDPLTHYPAYNAVLWQRGHAIKNLGTFGGNVSSAVSVNNLGQVVGGATNKNRRSICSRHGPCWSLNCWPAATQWRAFIWQGGAMNGFGHAGTGNDAVAGLLNASGQVAASPPANPCPQCRLPSPENGSLSGNPGRLIGDVFVRRRRLPAHSHSKVQRRHRYPYPACPIRHRAALPYKTARHWVAAGQQFRLQHGPMPACILIGGLVRRSPNDLTQVVDRHRRTHIPSKGAEILIA